MYDGAGRLLLVNSDGGTYKRFEYDGLDRLVKLVVNSAVTTYRYDAEGPRLSRKTIDRVNGKNDAIYYEYDGGQAIVERDGAGAAQALVTRGAGGELLTPEQLGKSPNVFLTDYLGSVIQMQDSTQKTVNQYTYDSFGNVTSATEGVKNDWKFTGANYDGATGLYQLGARYYAPADGRFITQDTYLGSPWQPWTQHLYVYVGNNPVNYTDPTGHCPWCIAAAVGAVVKAGLYCLHACGTDEFSWGDLAYSAATGAVTGLSVATGGLASLAIGAVVGVGEALILDSMQDGYGGDNWDWWDYVDNATGFNQVAGAFIPPGSAQALDSLIVEKVILNGKLFARTAAGVLLFIAFLEPSQYHDSESADAPQQEVPTEN